MTLADQGQTFSRQNPYLSYFRLVDEMERERREAECLRKQLWKIKYGAFGPFAPMMNLICRVLEHDTFRVRAFSWLRRRIYIKMFRHSCELSVSESARYNQMLAKCMTHLERYESLESLSGDLRREARKKCLKR